MLIFIKSVDAIYVFIFAFSLPFSYQTQKASGRKILTQFV